MTRMRKTKMGQKLIKAAKEVLETTKEAKRLVLLASQYACLRGECQHDDSSWCVEWSDYGRVPSADDLRRAKDLLPPSKAPELGRALLAAISVRLAQEHHSRAGRKGVSKAPKAGNLPEREWDFESYLALHARYDAQHDPRYNMALEALRREGGQNWKDSLCQADIVRIAVDAALGK